MRLQSKKSNQSLLPPSIVIIFLLSLIYWLYLSMTTHMVIANDSIGYEYLGRMINAQGWISYFTTGPNREPLYPLLIAASIQIGHFTGLAYVKVMAIFGVLIMFLTQILTYKLLRLLNIRNGICVLVLVYMALSPGLNNAAFSLYSEIATFPIILGIILTSTRAWDAIKQNNRPRAFVYGALLGILLTAATLIKAVFECITPAYLIILFATVFLTKKKIASSQKNAPRNDTLALLLCLAAAVSFYYVPITGYKWLNKHYNGNFVITNRGPWAIYGNTARRMEPLTFKRFAEALAYVPGEGVCNSLFGPKECAFWSFSKSDALGLKKQKELTLQMSPEKINSTLIVLSAQKALQNPFQYALLTFVEGLKMFFWESTKIGFVGYPDWLQKIYDVKLFNNGLRFFVSLISLIAVVSLWLEALRPHPSPIGFIVSVLISLYILFFSFFFILTRYALPIAPLYLIAIGIWINKLAPKK
jgi:hypothetical protein